MANKPQFIKTNEVGRPTQRENKPILFNNFSLGTDQHNPTTSATGGIARIINGRCERATTLDRRKGKVVMVLQEMLDKCIWKTLYRFRMETIFF